MTPFQSYVLDVLKSIFTFIKLKNSTLKVILYVSFFLFTSNSIIAQVNPNNIEIVRGEYGTRYVRGGRKRIKDDTRFVF